MTRRRASFQRDRPLCLDGGMFELMDENYAAAGITQTDRVSFSLFLSLATRMIKIERKKDQSPTLCLDSTRQLCVEFIAGYARVISHRTGTR